MQKVHGKPDRERTIIIVAPPGALIRVVRRTCNEGVIVFASDEEFNLWAALHGADGQSRAES